MRAGGDVIAPVGFYTPFLHQLCRRLRNSHIYSTFREYYVLINLVSLKPGQAQYILTVRLRQIPSKFDSGRLNPPMSLELSPLALLKLLLMSHHGFGDAYVMFAFVKILN